MGGISDGTSCSIGGEAREIRAFQRKHIFLNEQRNGLNIQQSSLWFCLCLILNELFVIE
jgi:hypothetical protein